MMWRKPLLLTATMTVLLLWLLTGCSGGERARSGNQQEDEVGDSSIKQQKAKQEERTVSVVPRQPTVSVEAEDNRNSKLVFQSGSGEIWAMNARGSEPVRLTEMGKQYPTSSLSPDGKKIAYATGRTEGGCGGASACASTSPEKSYAQINVMNTDGSDQTQLMEDLGTSSTPTWSPDGEKIAYVRDTSDTSSIYVVGSDGSPQPSLGYFRPGTSRLA